MSQRFIAGNIESGDTADPESMQREARNVVLFGESGVGKSSIINTIVGRAVAETHNLVQGCTRQCAPHTVALDSRTEIKLWDTVGLDEGTDGSIPLFQARQMLKEFLQRQHSTSGGIDLLLCCVRAGRMKTADFERYKFVYEEVCRKTIPVAIVVTGLENYQPEGDMDWWWSVNERELLKLGFQFCAHACVTSLPRESFGIGDVHRVDLSEQRLRDLLRREFRAPRNVIVFGESRTDRTALIDMITGHNTERRHGQGTENAFLFDWSR
ncbi:hypothetical protein BS17DRAFT_427950 [Gyrodon lividus]|nr:hypothetical protein BS17DRAFT_427950 [Gyrodon lividus]